LDLATDPYARAQGVGTAFDSCLFLSSDLMSSELSKILSSLVPLVRPGGAIVLGIGRIFSDTVGVSPSIIPPTEIIVTDGHMTLEKTEFVAGKPRRMAVQQAMMRFARKFSGPPSIASFLSLAAAGGLAAISLWYNQARVSQGPTTNKSHMAFTSLFLRFRRSPVDTVDGGRFHQRDESELSPSIEERRNASEQVAGPEMHSEGASHPSVTICEAGNSYRLAMREQ
jgi:hypothetical protein